MADAAPAQDRDDTTAGRAALERRVAELDQSLEQALVAAEDAQEEARLLAEDRIALDRELAEQRHTIAGLHHRLAEVETERETLRDALGRADWRRIAKRHNEFQLSEELQASYEELQMLIEELERANATLEQRVDERTAQLAESEARYRTLFEVMDEGFLLAEVIVIGNRPTDILYLEANPAAVRMTGQNYTGRRLREIDPRFEHHWYEVFGRVAVTGEPARMERFAAPLGAWFDFYVFKVGAPHERRVAIVFQDVTERKRAERALQDSERMLREALSAGGMAAWTWDPQTGLVTASGTATEVFGLHPGDNFRDAVRDFRLVHPDDLPRYRALVENAAAAGESWHCEFRIRRPRDGRTAWLEERATVTPDPLTGKPRIAGLVWDVTERTAAEQEMRRAKDAAEAASRAKTRFLAAASHDLRQPIQAAALYAYVLRASIGPAPAAAEALALLTASIESLNGMLSGLLDLSRLEAGAVGVSVTDFAPDELMRRLAAEFSGMSGAAGVDLRCVVSSLAVATDPQLLERVLRNLIANAITHGGTAGRGRVLFGVRRRKAAVEFQVWDNGQGIPPEAQGTIFEEFRQLKNPERNPTHGFGLGLSIVARIARLLGLEVSVRSQVGRGSVFAVAVPRARAPKPVRLAAPSLDDVDEGAAARLKGRSVLLVEDDERVRRGLAMMLKSWGVRVVAVSSTEELAARLPRLRSRPHAVLTDYRLPGGATGRTVVELVRQRWDVPGVIITGDTAPERLREAISLGCRLLHKPVQPFELVQALSEVLHA
ncbi:ATP-binding protein [Azospirillum sp. TSO22-1]|uniref:PAS domain-containing hybrid sensor histidine kinase/response regulator n=1 Tax=Azospirillum sp. TSO22-1 TaxID=716789 RepID=UPI000D65E180|nr:ATP-binding protein [Azospirillum sp. TSO22-1]